MHDPRERVQRAFHAQLRARRATLDAGATHVGWKVALGIDEVEAVVGTGPVFGYLTSATRLEPGNTFPARGIRDLRADTEVAVELGRDVQPSDDLATVRAAIARLATALELVDVEPPVAEFEGVVATNVLHRAFALGPFRHVALGHPLTATLRVNDELRAEATTSEDFAAKLVSIACLLHALDQRLRAGDRIIMGSIIQVPIQAGDAVEAAIDPLGSVALAIAE